MTEQEAYILLKQKIEKFKPYAGLVGYTKHDKHYPEFYEGYNELCKDYEAIRIHANRNVFPEKLFKERSPNQTAEEFKYIKENYKQITLPVFMDLLTSVQRAFNDWNIEYKESKKEDSIENKYRQFVESEIPVFHSVENYIRHIVPRLKMSDAMGVTVIKPKIKTKIDGKELKEDDQELRTPEIHYFQTPLIWGCPLEGINYFMIHSHEKSLVNKGGQKGLFGHVIWIIDEKNFYVFSQKGDYEKMNFVLTESFEHQSGTMPVRYFKGVPAINEHGKLIYHSAFLFSVDTLDIITLDQSNLQISKNKCVYPQQVMIGNICNFIDAKTNTPCIDGYLGVQGTDFHMECPACKGTGMKSRISPQGTLLLKGRTRESEGESVNDALTYVSPEISTVEFLRKEIYDNFRTARSILHLKNSESTTGENVVESASNQKALYAFIKPESDQMFSLYEWILDVIGNQRYGEDYPKPKVIYPQSFEFLTDIDYLNLIKEAQLAGSPPFIIYNLMWKYFSSIYYTEKDSAKVAELLMKTDRLVTLSANDINTGLINKTILPWEKILHESGINIVIELQNEDENFLNKEFKEQQTIIVKKAQEKAAEVKAVNSIQPVAIPAFTAE